MRYKKYSYVLVLILMLVVGINKTYAGGPDSDGMCYYLSPTDSTKDLKVKVELRYGEEATSTDNLILGSSLITINKFNETIKYIETPMLNWASHYKSGSGFKSITNGTGTVDTTTNGTKFEIYYPSTHHDVAPLLNETSPSCPKYIVIEFNKTGTNEYYGWGTESESKAAQAVSSSTGTATYTYASNYKNGTQITKEMYYGNLEETGLIGRDSSTGEYTCDSLGIDLFGTPGNPTKLRYYIDSAMQYIRIIVPILIIVLGTLDFAKAVLAGKEDNMKKAQSTFVKRLIAGIIVFFVPLLVDVIMDLADIVWQGTGYIHCDF